MPSVLKRLGWVVLAAMLASLPAAIYIASKVSAPFWYLVLLSIFQSLGIGLFAIGAGVLVLVAARGKTNGGLKPALITAVALGAFSSFSVISAASRI